MFLWFSLGCLLLLFSVAVFNIFSAPRLGRGCRWVPSGDQQNFRASPLVSLLVPARNEAHQIASCVESLLASDYPCFEVIVLDDQSTDGTADILRKLVANNPSKLSIIHHNESPPPGWTGKAHACQELAKSATGEILVFCDADVEVAPHAVSATVGYFLRHKVGALTVLPRQLGGSALVQAVVSLITQFSVVISLPLLLVFKTRVVSLATGNGQWFAWSRPVYERVGGHSAVRGSRIEDVELARLVKRSGFSLVSAIATHDMRVQMYADWASARTGFRKNLFALVGNSHLGLACVVGITIVLILSPLIFWYTWGWAGVLLSLCIGLILLIAQRILFATSFGVIALFPIGVLVTLGLLCESAYFSRKGKLVWKDRVLPELS
jgi:chlorobactene glucosyltransferase